MNPVLKEQEKEQGQKIDDGYDAEGNRLLTTPSGLKCRMRKGTGRDVKKAHRIVSEGGGSALQVDVFVALAAIKTEFQSVGSNGEVTWEKKCFEDVEGLEDCDTMFLTLQVQRPLGKPSSPST